MNKIYNNLNIENLTKTVKMKEIREKLENEQNI